MPFCWCGLPRVRRPDRAGLRIYDRIYEVGGRRFAKSDEFRQLANSLPAPLEFLVETQGKTRHMTIEPLETVTDAPAKSPPIPATANADFAGDSTALFWLAVMLSSAQR